MKRFPDIIVISWECDCGTPLSMSIDQADGIDIETDCTNCHAIYTLTNQGIEVDVQIERTEITA